MKRLALIAVLAFGLVGCSAIQKRPDLTIQPVVPQQGEFIAVDQAIIIADSSSSMRISKIRFMRDMVYTLTGTMPDGDYEAGMIAFGGDKTLVTGLQPFNRNLIQNKAIKMPYLGGTTHLETVLEKAFAMIGTSTGKTAVILFSDGLPSKIEYALAAAQKLADHPSSNVCLHTVLIGDNENGADFLQSVASLTPCGSFRYGDSLVDLSEMHEYVRHVFLALMPEKDDVIPDSDNDGVLDPDDECPDTPRGAKVDARGCWTIPGLTFERDKSDIRPEFFPRLNGVAKVLKDNPNLRIYIDGHTCSIATEKYNQALSTSRSEMVKSYMVDKGIDESRLVPRGFGETKPILPNDSEENMSKNRRVELKVIK